MPNTPPTLPDYLKLSTDAYSLDGLLSSGQKLSTFEGMTVIDQSTPEDLLKGFAAIAVQDSNGNIIIINEGTLIQANPYYPILYPATFMQQSISADIKIGSGDANAPALIAASAFALDVETKAQQFKHTTDTVAIYTTGHSLGGIEAQREAKTLEEHGELAGGATFGATGLPGQSFAEIPVDANYNSLFKNYVDRGDMVGNFAKDVTTQTPNPFATGAAAYHFGEVVEIGDASHAAYLQTAQAYYVAGHITSIVATEMGFGGSIGDAFQIHTVMNDALALTYHKMENYANDLNVAATPIQNLSISLSWFTQAYVSVYGPNEANPQNIAEIGQQIVTPDFSTSFNASTNQIIIRQTESINTALGTAVGGVTTFTIDPYTSQATVAEYVSADGSVYKVTYDTATANVSTIQVNENNGKSYQTNYAYNMDGSIILSTIGYTGANLTGSQSYKQTANISFDGEVTLDIIGTGDIISFDNTPITFEASANATLSGTGDIIYLHNSDILTLSGNGNTIAATSGVDRTTDVIIFDGHSIANSLGFNTVDTYGRLYTLDGTTLTIKGPTDTLTINGFQFGDFGISPGPGYYMVKSGDTWASIVSHSAFSNLTTALNGTVLQNLNAALGISSTLTAGELIYFPINYHALGTTGVNPATYIQNSDTKYPRYTFVYDALGSGNVSAGQVFVMGSKLDGSNTGAFIINKADNDGSFPTFDAGTFGTVGKLSNGTLNIQLTMPSGLLFGTLAIPTSGAATFTATNGAIITLSSFSNAHVNAPISGVSPKDVLSTYFLDLGTVLADINTVNFNFLNPTGTAFTPSSSKVASANHTYATNTFTFASAKAAGAQIGGSSSVTIASQTYNSVNNVLSVFPYAGGGNSYNFSRDVVSGMQTLSMGGTNVTMTQAEFGQFTGFNGAKGIYGGGTLILSDGGTLDLTSSVFDTAYNYNLTATGWNGSTLKGNNQNNQTLTASLLGNDTLIAGTGTGVSLIAGNGVDTLTGGTGVGDTFVTTSYGLAAGSAVTGNGTNDILFASGDISGATITGIETLRTDNVTLTDTQMNGFTNIIAQTTAGTITAATAGTYSRFGNLHLLPGSPTQYYTAYNMTAIATPTLTNPGTVLEENYVTNVKLRTSRLGNDTLKTYNSNHVVLQTLGANSATADKGLTTGNDTLIASGGNTNTLDATGSTGTVVLDASGDTGDILRAGDGTTTMYGSATSATLFGGAGTDTMNLLAGAEAVTGGTGDAIIKLTGQLASNSTIAGNAAANNTLVITNTASSDISLATITNVKTLQVNGTSTTAITMTAAEFNAFTTLVNMDANGVVNTDPNTVVKITITTAGTYSFTGKSLKGKFQLDTANTGGLISGQGVTLASSSAIIGLASATSATLTGNSNIVTLQSTDALTINGNSNNVSDSSSTNGNTVKDSTGNTASVFTLNGTSDIAKLYGSGDTVNVNGTSGQVFVTGQGAALSSGATSFASGVETITFSGATIKVASGLQTTITGTDGVMTVNNDATTPLNTINWYVGGSELQEFTGLLSGTAQELIEYTGANATGSITKVTSNFTAGGSQIDLYNPTTNIALENMLYSGANGTGTNTNNYVTFANGDTETQNYVGIGAGHSAEIFDYNGSGSSRTIKKVTTNFLSGGSQVDLYNPTPLIAWSTSQYAGASGTGSIIATSTGFTSGDSQYHSYGALWPGVSDVIYDYHGNDSSRVNYKTTTNFVAGGSQVDLYNPSSSVTQETDQYTGLNGTGTITAKGIYFTSGKSEYQGFAGGPGGGVAAAIFDYDSAHNLELSTYNWSTGGSRITHFTNLPTGISKQYFDYSGANGTGTLDHVFTNWSAGGCQVIYYTGIPAGMSAFIYNYSGADSTGTLLSTAMVGTSGDDLFNPTTQNQTLIGNGGSDTYRFGNSYGQDIIQNGLASNTGPTGELSFGGSLTKNQIWFEHIGNDLQVDIMGTQDHMTIAGWYSNDASKLSDIKTSDGSVIDSQLNQLVQAMATYSTNNAGFNPTGVSQAPSDTTLQSAIAASWHN